VQDTQATERKAGQLLAKTVKRGGDQKSNGSRGRLKLFDVGVSEKQSKTRQKLGAGRGSSQQCPRGLRQLGSQMQGLNFTADHAAFYTLIQAGALPATLEPLKTHQRPRCNAGLSKALPRALPKGCHFRNGLGGPMT
jgi:hypothetical protein